MKKKYTHLTQKEREQIVFALSEYNILHVHSITYDNGCEFAGHEYVN